MLEQSANDLLQCHNHRLYVQMDDIRAHHKWSRLHHPPPLYLVGLKTERGSTVLLAHWLTPGFTTSLHKWPLEIGSNFTTLYTNKHICYLSLQSTNALRANDSILTLTPRKSLEQVLVHCGTHLICVHTAVWMWPHGEGSDPKCFLSAFKPVSWSMWLTSPRKLHFAKMVNNFVLAADLDSASVHLLLDLSAYTTTHFPSLVILGIMGIILGVPQGSVLGPLLF